MSLFLLLLQFLFFFSSRNIHLKKKKKNKNESKHEWKIPGVNLVGTMALASCTNKWSLLPTLKIRCLKTWILKTQMTKSILSLIQINSIYLQSHISHQFLPIFSLRTCPKVPLMAVSLISAVMVSSLLFPYMLLLCTKLLKHNSSSPPLY